MSHTQFFSFIHLVTVSQCNKTSQSAVHFHPLGELQTIYHLVFLQKITFYSLFQRTHWTILGCVCFSRYIEFSFRQHLKRQTTFVTMECFFKPWHFLPTTVFSLHCVLPWWINMRTKMICFWEESFRIKFDSRYERTLFQQTGFKVFCL